ncbi:hypothetical protein MCOR27_002070 [Pyricularia oryzae]|uniref:TLDc domain-containing protein n=1 Tax=Pyricularia grisea TaxID=148305 RepID=A0ABQ8NM19_PYRGI|nr:hypothetical protein MCOR01_003816 [Pyricularia oryzae]KAI6299169.1 hypothetical protein MCOR33_004816 [Pyricularia grisea]KAH9427339.1 hypothetical protein MCOR02_012245 [Pyricularia oryzae]KAI6260666.1 hypothetical protein MCOR19_003012 [Pyricularia oryzae]KAI6286055.1 hypothetical protein MCOR27_002070 [Pyricularia oryzae]
MLSSLDNFIQAIAFGHARRDVQRYLDAATRTSVRHDLTEKLASQLRFKEREHLRTTFDKYAVDISGGKHWTEQSFCDQIRSSYQDTVISENAIKLLWRSFLFYANHPFSSSPCLRPQDALVDFEQFKLAVLLTVFQRDRMLGTLDDANVYWREDGALRNRQSGFDRMFSSLVCNAADPGGEKPEQLNEGFPSAMSDAMDVLVMAAPAHMHLLPAEQHLLPTVQRLFASKDGTPAVQRGQVFGRSEVQTLMDLLLRLRVRQSGKAWGSEPRLYPGDLLEASSGDSGLTKALVNTLMGTDRIDGAVTVRQLSGAAVGLMPNLLLRFQELWAVLFQPTEGTEEKKPPTGESRLSQLGAVISLFAPTVDTSRVGSLDHKEEDTRFILQASAQSNSDSRNTTMNRVVEATSGSSSGHVILFTTSAEKSASKTVMGGYFPSPEKGLPHVLFQLQSNLRVFRSRKTGIPLGKLIKSEQEQGADCKEEASSPRYWIGDSAGAMSTGIRVDPDTTATLLLGEGSYYMDMDASRAAHGGKTQQVVIQDATMEVYAVANASVTGD